MNVEIATQPKEEVIEGLKALRPLTSNEADKICHMIRISTYYYCGRINGELVCVWGLVAPSLLAEQAYLWLTCTPALEEHKFIFVRHSQRVIERALNEFPRIVGYCDESNDRAMRWIKWLGGRFSEPRGGKLDFEITRKLHG